MKVGIASCYYHHNYGSMLQAYATQRIIEKLGCDSITIACNSPIAYMTQNKITYYFHKVTNPDIVKTKIRQFKSKKIIKLYPSVRKGRIERDEYFDNFYKKYIKLSQNNITRYDLTSVTSACDAVVVGSDMLWHPINVEHDYYTLMFVPDTVKKIAYATSFGTTKIPGYQVEIYKQFLNRFSSISVREKSGVDLIKSLGIDKMVSVVLDPTLLFTGDEWLEIQKVEPIYYEKYIFCYFLGVNQEHRNFANRLKEITGFQIVALQHLDEFVVNDLNFGDIKPYNVGPGEFVNLIRNAEYICTDSFHGTCFSILNHKKFYTFNRFNNKNTQSTNTRIDSLLEITGLENRRITSEDDAQKKINDINSDIDYDIVDEKLIIFREQSIDYLKEAISL